MNRGSCVEFGASVKILVLNHDSACIAGILPVISCQNFADELAPGRQRTVCGHTRALRLSAQAFRLPSPKSHRELSSDRLAGRQQQPLGAPLLLFYQTHEILEGPSSTDYMGTSSKGPTLHIAWFLPLLDRQQFHFRIHVAVSSRAFFHSCRTKSRCPLS
jgi:hypothetical protein